MTSKLILVGGGARSGKSRFALSYAERLGQRRVFIATAEAHDAEMRERIQRHRDERGGRFQTVEEPFDLPRALQDVGHAEVVVIDCLTLWLANRLLRDGEEAVVTDEIRRLVDTLARRRCHTVVVSNEVGMGLVPENALGRRFRDLAGAMHQRLATIADEVYLAAMGMLIRLQPSPVTAFRAGELP
jgi:adenosylcobinamide kinase/adenosylcobinamide-phosphate guanylyltransferase